MRTRSTNQQRHHQQSQRHPSREEQHKEIREVHLLLLEYRSLLHQLQQQTPYERQYELHEIRRRIAAQRGVSARGAAPARSSYRGAVGEGPRPPPQLPSSHQRCDYMVGAARTLPRFSAGGRDVWQPTMYIGVEPVRTDRLQPHAGPENHWTQRLPSPLPEFGSCPTLCDRLERGSITKR